MDVATSQDICADKIDASDWPMRPLGSVTGRREATFQVVFGPGALQEIHRHGRSDLKVEVGGVLVGKCYRDSAGPYLLVEAAIPGIGTRGQSTQVTFTAETWTHVQREMDLRFPDSKMLGWYHTHPGFGIFLSEMDLFIHGNFFNLPWQVAFVYDPKSNEEGLFIWRQGKTQAETWLTEAAPAVAPTRANATNAMQGIDPLVLQEQGRIIAELRARMKRAEARIRQLAVMFCFLLAVVGVWAWYLFPRDTGAQQDAPPPGQEAHRSVAPATAPVMKSTTQPASRAS